MSAFVIKHPTEHYVSRDGMVGALVERLHSFSTPSSEDIEAIRGLPLFIKQVEAHHFVVRDGQRPTHCCLVAAGFCVRTKTTGDGSVRSCQYTFQANS
jgi:hypothetical protein